MKLGKRIAELREAQEVTLAELAFRANVDVNTIRNIESCTSTNPRLNTVIAILQRLKAIDLLMSYNWKTGEVA